MYSGMIKVFCANNDSHSLRLVVTLPLLTQTQGRYYEAKNIYWMAIPFLDLFYS